MAFLNYPKKVVLGDITVRDGLQHEEKFIPTELKAAVDFTRRWLDIGRTFEKIIGRRLRAECVHTGRIPKG